MVCRGRDDSVRLGWVGEESSSSPLPVSNLLVDCSLRAWLQLCHITPVVVQSHPTHHLKTPDEQWCWEGLCCVVASSCHARYIGCNHSLSLTPTNWGGDIQRPGYLPFPAGHEPMWADTVPVRATLALAIFPKKG